MISAVTEPIIRVQGLGKLYQIGESEPYGLLSDRIGQIVRNPLRRLLGRDGGNEPGHADSTKGLQSFWALKDVSFDVFPGEILGVVGLNGSGKSTLLKILSRITSPSAGQVEITGRVASLLEVGTGFHPELTGRENVFLNGAILGMSRRQMEELFDKIVDYAEVGQFIDTPVKHYSSGMKIRLGFSVAVHLDSEILIVDEVLSVGDLAFQRKSMATIKEMHQKGRTILFVTHNTELLSQIASRCVYIEKGQVKGLGPTQDVLKLYQRNVVTKTDSSSHLVAGLPTDFRRQISNPAVAIENLSISATGPAVNGSAVPVTGQPARLTFEIVALKDVEQVDPRILYLRDGFWIRWDHGYPNIAPVTLKAGERQKVEISYPSFTLSNGSFVLVAFVAPSVDAQSPETISQFAISRMKIEHGSQKDGGNIYLEQTWHAHEVESLSSNTKFAEPDVVGPG